VTRTKLTLGSFARLVGVFLDLSTDAEENLFTEAISETLIFKVCQVRWLLHKMAHKARTVIDQIYPAVDVKQADRGSLLEFFNEPMPLDQNAGRKAANAFIFFNAQNPTFSYELDLQNPMQRLIAERMVLINKVEKTLFSEKAPGTDFSQFGGEDWLRNVRFDGLEIKESQDWADLLRGTGLLAFDYTSPFGALGNSKADGVDLVTDEDLEPLLTLLRGDCPCEKKVDALHSVSHRFAITAEQSGKILEMFSGKPRAAPPVEIAKSNGKARKKRKVPPPKTTGYLKPGHYSTYLSPRVGAFVSLMRRTVGAPSSMLPFLHDSKLFTPGELKEIRARFGLPLTLALDQADSVYGSARPSYTLDMAVHEEKRVAQWFAEVAKVEGPEVIGEAQHVSDESAVTQPWPGDAVPNTGKLIIEIKAPSAKKDSGARASAAKQWLRLDSIALGKGK
jgi:hypothetical protein